MPSSYFWPNLCRFQFHKWDASSPLPTTGTHLLPSPTLITAACRQALVRSLPLSSLLSLLCSSEWQVARWHRRREGGRHSIGGGRNILIPISKQRAVWYERTRTDQIQTLNPLDFGLPTRKLPSEELDMPVCRNYTIQASDLFSRTVHLCWSSLSSISPFMTWAKVSNAVV